MVCHFISIESSLVWTDRQQAKYRLLSRPKILFKKKKKTTSKVLWKVGNNGQFRNKTKMKIIEMQLYYLQSFIA